MFWGLIMEPGKSYSQEVVNAFHISMATLEMDEKPGGNYNIPVLLKYTDGREFVLCNLNPSKREQCALDLNFREGEKIGFYSGSRQIKVHLTGYTLADLEESSDDDYEGEEESEEEEIEEISEDIAQKRKYSSIERTGAKKMKLAESIKEIEEMVEKNNEEKTGAVPTTKKLISLLHKKTLSENETEKESDQIKKKKEKVADSPVKEQNGQMQSPTEKTKKKKKKKKKKSDISGEIANAISPQKKTVEGGVEIVDRIIGSGPVAQPGAKIAVYYVGRLGENNKQFDATTSGSGFKFTLGRGEVIKGWDVGVPGMRVGGKRTLTIPGHMAYGKKGHPPVIPPHSTLVFDVELKNVF